MIFSLFHTIGARLNAVMVIIILGFGTIGISATVFFEQMESEYRKRQALFDQEHHLDQLRSNILTSIVFMDDILFKSNTSAIPQLLAVNEDTLSSFAAFQASAEENELLNDVYLAMEYEPVVYRLRTDFYNAVSLFRKGEIESAKLARENVLDKRLKIVNAFIDNSHALRVFDIIDQDKVITSLRGKIITWSLVIFALTVSVCFLVLLFAGRSITKPIITLMRVMKKFSPENYQSGISLNVGELGHNEIGILGETFVEMASNIQQNIEGREQIQKELKDSLARTESILSRIIDGIVVCSEDGMIEIANFAAANIFDAHASDMIGKSLNSLLVAKNVTVAVKADINPCILAETGQITEFERASSSGVISCIEIAATSLNLGKENVLIVSLRDITVRKHAEDQIKASLAEKETLLREIHHRVKNNLQVISSLLSLQASTETDHRTIDALKESQRRVGVMARIHETLHQSDDLASINAREYLTTLIEDTKASSGDNSQGISFHLNADDIIFDVDHAIPCGQIISELLSNSLKHAFPNGQSGNIEVSLHRRDGGKIELAVADDGKGLPENFELERSETLGMNLVSALARQLRGVVEVAGSGGTRVQITFPEKLL